MDHLKATGSPSGEIVTDQKMDAALKAKLVAALRGGTYEQGRCELRSRSNKFCCLGVALEIQGAQWQGGAAALNGATTLPLETPAPQMLGGLARESADILVAMNDGTDGYRKHSFPEIADYIEQNL